VEVIDDISSVLVPQKHVATVTAADDVLAAWTVEVDTFHCYHINTSTNVDMTPTEYFTFTLSGFITALHGMQTRSSDENSVCPSIRHTRAL